MPAADTRVERLQNRQLGNVRIIAMKIQQKFVSGMLFFVALLLLFLSLDCFAMALDYSGFADNWRKTFFFMALLTFLFGLGWSLQHFAEYLALSNHRNISLLVCLIPFIAFYLVSLLKIPAGFLGFALSASSFIILSGQFLRFSSTFTHPDILDKLVKAIRLET
jgi:hypothetical protein